MVKVVLAVAPFLATIMAKTKVAETTAHIQTVVGKGHGKNNRSVDVGGAHTMLSELEEAVAKRVNEDGQSKSNPLAADIANAIFAQFDLLDDHLESEQVLQQKEATDSNHAIAACISQKTLSFSKADGVDALKILVEAKKTSHITCRQSEKLSIGSKDVACQLYFDQGTSFVSTAPDCTCSYEENGKVDSLDDATALKTCFQATKTWVDAQEVLVTKQSACVSLSATASGESVTCNAAQGTYENHVCTYNLELTGTCNTFDTCLAPENQDTLVKQRTASLKMITDSVSASKETLKATTKARCLLTLLMKAEIPTADLKACTDLVVKDTHLNVNYPAELEPGTCDDTSASPAPGDEAWKADQYQTEEWFTNVQAVTPCLVTFDV